jgi:hypothetical protein
MRSRIIASRGTGKTKELMRLALENNGIFVCQNARHMREKALAYGFVGLQIMSFDEFISNIQDYPISYAPDITMRGYKDPDGRQFYIDEVEGFVNFICLNTFAGYSLSLE